MGTSGHFRRFSDKFLTPGQGGPIVYRSTQFDQVWAAIADFSVYVQDPKAEIIALYVRTAGSSNIGQLCFYDAPTPPPGIFDNFTNIPATLSDMKTRSYLDMFMVANSDPFAGFR